MLCGIAYNSAGQAYLHTSYSNAAATTVANQDQDVYNGLGQMIGQYQAVSGAVNTASTPEVQWGFSTIANGSRKGQSKGQSKGETIQRGHHSLIDPSSGGR